jgi:hypothetical protein
MLVEATQLRRRLEEAHAIARCSAAQGGVDADYDSGCVAGFELALTMIAELEGRDGILCVTEKTGGHYRG